MVFRWAGILHVPPRDTAHVSSAYAFSVFVNPIEIARPEWPKVPITAASWALATLIFTCGVVNFFIGALLDQLGPRLYGIIGSILFASGWVVAGAAIRYGFFSLFVTGIGRLFVSFLTSLVYCLEQGLAS